MDNLRYLYSSIVVWTKPQARDITSLCKLLANFRHILKVIEMMM